jgi:hypothetical protein
MHGYRAQVKKTVLNAPYMSEAWACDLAEEGACVFASHCSCMLCALCLMKPPA